MIAENRIEQVLRATSLTMDEHRVIDLSVMTEKINAEPLIFPDELLADQCEIDTKRLQVLNELTAYDQALGLQ